MGQLCFHSISLPTHHCRGINLGSLDKNRTRFSEKYVFSPPYISGVPLMRAQFAFCDQLRPVGILASSFHPTAYNLERLRPRKRPTKTTKKMYMYTSSKGTTSPCQKILHRTQPLYSNLCEESSPISNHYLNVLTVRLPPKFPHIINWHLDARYKPIERELKRETIKQK